MNPSPLQDPRLRRFCLGTMTFGREADREASRAMFQRAREAGVGFFDCADLYANGEAERILGELVRDCRGEVILTSKVGMRQGLAPAVIRESLEKSLTNLRTDYLDVYYCHCFDPAVPVLDTLETLGRLVEAGKIRWIGVSNWSAWQVARALGHADHRGLPPIRFVQPLYNLLKRTAEIEILPMAKAEGLVVASYNPLAGGVLTGKYLYEDPSVPARLREQATYARRYASQVEHLTALRFVEVARRVGVHPVTLAVAWVARHPAITAPILGARHVEQLEPALAALDYRLSDEVYREICALTPPIPPSTDRTEEPTTP